MNINPINSKQKSLNKLQLSNDKIGANYANKNSGAYYVSFCGSGQSFLSAQLSRILASDVVNIERKSRIHSIIDNLIINIAPEKRKEGVSALIQLINSDKADKRYLAQKIISPYRMIVSSVAAIENKVCRLGGDKALFEDAFQKASLTKQEVLTKSYKAGFDSGMQWIRRLISEAERNKCLINSIENGPMPPETLDLPYVNNWLGKTKHLLKKFEIEQFLKDITMIQEQSKQTSLRKP